MYTLNPKPPPQNPQNPPLRLRFLFSDLPRTGSAPNFGFGEDALTPGPVVLQGFKGLYRVFKGFQGFQGIEGFKGFKGF